MIVSVKHKNVLTNRKANNRAAVLQFINYLALLFAACVLSGCAAIGQQQASQQVLKPHNIKIDKTIITDDASRKGWWKVGFHRHYELGDEVAWYYDTFIAYMVLKPILEKHPDMELWRFHRRASADNSGHNFSFIFYETRETGEQIYQGISEHPVTKWLLNNKNIERLSFYDINKELRSDIEATSDKNWPLELQKTWPYFIKGVSQTWLGLIDQFYKQLDFQTGAGLDDQLEGFRQVQAEIDQVWKERGGHAFLHHLNALFAYQELYIIERRLGRF